MYWIFFKIDDLSIINKVLIIVKINISVDKVSMVIIIFIKVEIWFINLNVKEINNVDVIIIMYGNWYDINISMEIIIIFIKS